MRFLGFGFCCAEGMGDWSKVIFLLIGLLFRTEDVEGDFWWAEEAGWDAAAAGSARGIADE